MLSAGSDIEKGSHVSVLYVAGGAASKETFMR
jgi:hypothetical protein